MRRLTVIVVAAASVLLLGALPAHADRLRAGFEFDYGTTANAFSLSSWGRSFPLTVRLATVLTATSTSAIGTMPRLPPVPFSKVQVSFPRTHGALTGQQDFPSGSSSSSLSRWTAE